ncbi:GPI-anchored cell wall beta-1,3-endoglucanase EglC [Chaetomium sp. MPI-SDFR-AT-0129]|nr:GPI-anchored cell wall beta-1,3-endoglucanase EglC [Chaetomium sp. MPI-SDFR-AT-0129]
MRGILSLTAFLAALSPAVATHQGFNYGAFFTDTTSKKQADFEADFNLAQDLQGFPTGTFNSARLYTMVQPGATDQPISAIPAVITTNTTLLLGLWCSAGPSAFTSELAALTTAMRIYSKPFTDLVLGISVGSEDLYRSSATGRSMNAGPGATAVEIVEYIRQLRERLRGTPLERVPIGHVDTWSEWVEEGNREVLGAVEFVGMDAYSYWQGKMENGVEQAGRLFNVAMVETDLVVEKVWEEGGLFSNKTLTPVWVTETGFPVSGMTVGKAVPLAENALRFWQEVGCGMLFGRVNTWWYTLRDVSRGTPVPSFGILGGSMGGQPLFELSCEKKREEGTCDAE